MSTWKVVLGAACTLWQATSTKHIHSLSVQWNINAIESFREERDGENQREWREGAGAENADWSIKAMELLLCTLGFLWLTSVSADHVLPHKKDTHTLAQHTRTQTNAHACTLRGVVEVCAKKSEMSHLRWHPSQDISRRKENVRKRSKAD